MTDRVHSLLEMAVRSGTLRAAYLLRRSPIGADVIDRVGDGVAEGVQALARSVVLPAGIIEVVASDGAALSALVSPRLGSYDVLAAPAGGEAVHAGLRFLEELLAQELNVVQATAQDRERIDRVLGEPMATQFQPVFDLRTRQLHALEALARFSEGSAAEWFALAERTGRSVEMETKAIDAALVHLGSLRSEGWISINVSARTLESSEMAEILQRVPPGRLALELSERGAAPTPGSGLQEARERLRSADVALILDDAGAGMVSLQHFVALKPDGLKLDMSLVRGVDEDSSKGSVVGGLVDIGNKIGSWVAAKGVETEAELSALEDLGVAYGQGFLLGRPSELTAWSMVKWQSVDPRPTPA